MCVPKQAGYVTSLVDDHFCTMKVCSLRARHKTRFHNRLWACGLWPSAHLDAPCKQAHRTAGSSHSPSSVPASMATASVLTSCSKPTW
jgi:hypothetical protein